MCLNSSEYFNTAIFQNTFPSMCYNFIIILLKYTLSILLKYSKKWKNKVVVTSYTASRGKDRFINV